MKKLIIRLSIVFALLFMAGLAYDQYRLPNILPKDKTTDFRIGYLNLHNNPISKSNIKRLLEMDCDMWCFLEWNGDNLDALPAFREKYATNLEVNADPSFGVLVLSKDSTATAKEIGQNDRPYACDFPKHLIHSRWGQVLFVHVPPPVPHCAFQSAEYIQHLKREILQLSNSQPTILLGDFNSLPFHTRMKTLDSLGFVDTYDATQQSLQGTFGPFGWMPKMGRIDYVFSKGNIKAQNAYRFSVLSSDHSGWVVDFNLK